MLRYGVIASDQARRATGNASEGGWRGFIGAASTAGVRRVYTMAGGRLSSDSDRQRRRGRFLSIAHTIVALVTSPAAAVQSLLGSPPAWAPLGLGPK